MQRWRSQRVIGRAHAWARGRRLPRDRHRSSHCFTRYRYLSRTPIRHSRPRDFCGLAEPTLKSRPPNLRAPISLAFRLRQLLGIGVRSEVIRTLLTIEAPRTSAGVLAAAVAFSKRNVQETLTELHLAGVISIASAGSDRGYALDRDDWAALLHIDPQGMPLHRDWPQLLGSVRKVLRGLRFEATDEMLDYLVASRVRELLSDVAEDLRYAGVAVANQITVSNAVEVLEDVVGAALELLRRGVIEPEPPIGTQASIAILRDAGDAYRWRMTAANEHVIAVSAERYLSRQDSERAARAFADQAPSARIDVYRDATQRYRWRARAATGRVLGVSADSFGSRTTAQRVADHARTARNSGVGMHVVRAVTPDGHGEGDELINPRRRHLTKRPDGRWEDSAEGAVRATSVHRTQAEAEAASRELGGRQPGGAEIVVHRPDGRIRERGRAGKRTQTDTT